MVSNRKLLSSEIKKGSFYLGIGLFIILALSGGFYLYSVSTASQMGYQFVQQERQKKTLENENEALKLKVLKAGSYATLSEDISGMTEPDSIEYFKSRMERLSRVPTPNLVTENPLAIPTKTD